MELSGIYSQKEHLGNSWKYFNQVQPPITTEVSNDFGNGDVQVLNTINRPLMSTVSCGGIKDHLFSTEIP